MLIINAGVAGPGGKHFQVPTRAEFDLVMHTNVLGPMQLIDAFALSVVDNGGVIAVLSSRMGSIQETTSADSLTYRTSKAAVNMVVKMAAMEHGLRGVTVVALHPGWVRTDMGGESALVGVSESVDGLRQVIGGLGADSNGGFFDHLGRSLHW
ncbi:SDR family NAD(P)-dependent oxidoreductase [Candidatus Dactylopiibacterium carminicum]|uniref:SDR family NAD(P)-dependent oxidoreductase n=1 Tax=Candidatus Dactylopiibacterium carminicum TaxID=857335 RepID=UPI0021E02A5C|nr:SDR family NAD(P)-dependent oxidoreductase [Candidatus Dactylopiibacterium carminicum]